MDKAVVTIRLFGNISVAAPDGSDITPRPMKAQALIALLATGRDQRRSRAWLQDRLWSDRSPKQASGSLRQALHDLRKALGEHAHILRTSRSAVELDRTATQLIDHDSAPASETEFLAGIDVRDPEFNNWLRDMRAHYEAQVDLPTPHLKPGPRSSKLMLSLVSVGSDDNDLNLLEAILLENIQRSLREFFDVEFMLGLPSLVQESAPPATNFVVRVQGMKTLQGLSWMRASLESAGSLHCHWTQTVPIADNEHATSDNLSCESLTHRLVAAFAELLLDDRVISDARTSTEADILAASALRRMFTMRDDEVGAAQHLLRQAMSLRSRGLYHAWQAQALSIRHVEQQVHDVASLREEADAHIRYALESEPMNSNVLAAAANTRLIFDNNVLLSSALARQAVALNRSNPLSWFAWANANLYGGHPERAYAAAVTAQALGANSSLEFWTSFQRALSAAVTGKLHEALSYAAVSNALAPSFRPPLRYLAGIATSLGRVPDAVTALHRLSEIEADFSVDRMVNDPAYPVSMMRRANLLKPEELSSLF